MYLIRIIHSTTHDDNVDSFLYQCQCTTVMIKNATSKLSAQARVTVVLEVDCNAQVTLTVPREKASQHAAAQALQ